MKSLEIKDRNSIFSYIVETFSMYYESIDNVQFNQNNAMVLSSRENDFYFNFCIHKDGDLKECIEQSLPLFKRYNREPFLYLTQASSYFGQDIQFEKVSQDAFMFLENFTTLLGHPQKSGVKVKLCKKKTKKIL